MRIIQNSLVLLLLAFSILLKAQDLQIVSNTTWTAGTSYGAYGLPTYDVGYCVNDKVIDCVCGEKYPSPNVSAQFAGCTGMQPIWGTPPPADCYYAAGTYWFAKKFELKLEDCEEVVKAVARVQGDNAFKFILNGTSVGGSTYSDWDTAFDFDVTSLLVPGTNIIEIGVENIKGGECFNYAFLAFCLNIDIEPITIDASFDLHAVPCADWCIYTDNYEMYTSLGATHTWYVLLSKEPCPDSPADFKPIVAVEFPYFKYPDLPKGYCIWVIHRVKTKCGEACYMNRVCPNDEKPDPKECPWVGPFPCEKIANWEFPFEYWGKQAGAIQQGSAANVASLQVSPNPANDFVQIQWSDKNPVQNIQWLNLDGKLLKTVSLDNGQTSLQLPTSQYPSGTYLLRVMDADGNITTHKVEVLR